MSLREQFDLSVCDTGHLPLMPTPIRSPEPVPGLHQSLGKQRVKIFLIIAFISNDSPELAGFPSLFDRIKCCVVKEIVDMPMWIAQAVNRSGVPMKELQIQQLAPFYYLRPAPPFRTLHCISASMAAIVSSTAALAIFSTTRSAVNARYMLSDFGTPNTSP